jgi:hypothetical protein
MVTTADMLRDEGRSQALRTWLLKLLSQRFGALPMGPVTRIDAADPVELEAWFDRGLTATTLAEVFAEG